MKKRACLIVSLAMSGMLMTAGSASAVSVENIPGEWVKATAGHDNGYDSTINTWPIGGDPNTDWFTIPVPNDWEWGDGPTDDKWYLEPTAGGINENGGVGRNGPEYSITYHSKGTVAPLQTTISGVPDGIYNIYVVYKSFPWSPSDAGVLSGIAGQPQIDYDHNNGVSAGVIGNPANIPFYYGLLGQASPVNGEIVVHVDVHAGARTYYEGLTYEPAGNILFYGQSDGSTVVSEEGATSDQYTVALSGQPTANVTVTISNADDPNQVTVSPTSLAFSDSDWDTPQTVTVTAIDDATLETDPHAALLVHETSSGDSSWDELSFNLGVSVLENECGAWGFKASDFNENCITDLEDFLGFSLNWLVCTTPNTPGCVQ